MSELHVRNVPDDLRAEIERIAREEGRSMSAQVTVLLREAARMRPSGTKRDAAARLRARARRYPLPAGTTTALIRDDRESR